MRGSDDLDSVCLCCIWSLSSFVHLVDATETWSLLCVGAKRCLRCVLMCAWLVVYINSRSMHYVVGTTTRRGNDESRFLAGPRWSCIFMHWFVCWTHQRADWQPGCLDPLFMVVCVCKAGPLLQEEQSHGLYVAVVFTFCSCTRFLSSEWNMCDVYILLNSWLCATSCLMSVSMATAH